FSARSVLVRSLSLIAAGVPVGTAQSDHEVTTRSGKPASTRVGASGTARDLCAPVLAIGLSLPAFTCAVSESTLAMHMGMWPATTSAGDAAGARYAIRAQFSAGAW